MIVALCPSACSTLLGLRDGFVDEDAGVVDAGDAGRDVLPDSPVEDAPLGDVSPDVVPDASCYPVRTCSADASFGAPREIALGGDERQRAIHSDRLRR